MSPPCAPCRRIRSSCCTRYGSGYPASRCAPPSSPASQVSIVLCFVLCVAASALMRCAMLRSSRQGKQPAPLHAAPAPGCATRRCVALGALPWLALLPQPATVCITPASAAPAGESEEQHRELVDFCTTFKFERMGCFQYSAEDGTPAAELPEQVRAAACGEVQCLVLRCSSMQRRKAMELVHTCCWHCCADFSCWRHTLPVQPLHRNMPCLRCTHALHCTAD